MLVYVCVRVCVRVKRVNIPCVFSLPYLSQWGGWVGISIIVAVGSILLVLIILCGADIYGQW